MDALSGKNSTGRRVSLLNDGPAPPPQLVRLPSITPSLQSRTSSYTTSPIGSPLTPRLVRSDSSESTSMATPSPITPDFTFELPPAQGLHSPVFSHNGFFSHQKELDSAYPSISQPSGPLPYHAGHVSQTAYFQQQQQQQQQHQSQHQSQPLSQPQPQPQPQSQSQSQPQPQPQSLDEQQATASSSGQRPKKNSYPCPMAKQFGCDDYFTTSGHAARHAKKHTGKKDAYCPECNKAFTRKDNMEQHRRTHQSGRNSAKGSDREVKKVKASAKRPKISPLQQDNIPALSQLSMVDPTLPHSPMGAFMAPAVQPSDSFLEFPSRSQYPDPTAFSMTHGYSTGSYSGGLDALAAAASASGEKRKFDS